MSAINQKRRRGRPTGTKDFRLVAVPHAEPNPLKLGRAFLALAVHRAEPQIDADPPQSEAGDGSA
jgi:hypothetical protein